MTLQANNIRNSKVDEAYHAMATTAQAGQTRDEALDTSLESMANGISNLNNIGHTGGAGTTAVGVNSIIATLSHMQTVYNEIGMGMTDTSMAAGNSPLPPGRAVELSNNIDDLALNSRGASTRLAQQVTDLSTTYGSEATSAEEKEAAAKDVELVANVEAIMSGMAVIGATGGTAAISMQAMGYTASTAFSDVNTAVRSGVPIGQALDGLSDSQKHAIQIAMGGDANRLDKFETLKEWSSGVENITNTLRANGMNAEVDSLARTFQGQADISERAIEEVKALKLMERVRNAGPAYTYQEGAQSIMGPASDGKWVANDDAIAVRENAKAELEQLGYTVTMNQNQFTVANRQRAEDPDDETNLDSPKPLAGLTNWFREDELGEQGSGGYNYAYGGKPNAQSGHIDWMVHDAFGNNRVR